MKKINFIRSFIEAKTELKTQTFLTILTHQALFILFIFICLKSQAQIISLSSEELEYQYTSKVDLPLEFTTQQTQYLEGFTINSPEDMAIYHAQYLFGTLHSPEFTKQMGINPVLIGGVGSPDAHFGIQILEATQDDTNKVIHITYSNTGKILLEKSVANNIMKSGQTLTLPMPLNPMVNFDEHCTDEHYNSFGDYWYFYNPFKSGCRYLLKKQNSFQTTLYFNKIKTAKKQTSALLPEVRGNNGNGSLFSIYVINGFNENKYSKDDPARDSFKAAEDYFLKNGFSKEKQPSQKYYPYVLYSKTQTLSTGEIINIEVRSLLVETSIQSKSKVFATFFKEAVENADVIYYGGHSGLGGNLDIPSLEEKVGKFKFKQNKKQIFFFDSCSSYSYYLEHFNSYKDKSNIDVLTYGLSSYFHTSPLVFQEFMNYLIGKDNRNIQWKTILNKMEGVLDGESYLLSVGGI